MAILKWLILLHLHCVICRHKNACRNFQDYFTLMDTNPNCFYNPDVFLDTPRLIQKYIGYHEKYEIVTDDGYILSIYRIPKKNPKKVILLHHPITADSATFVSQGPDSLDCVRSFTTCSIPIQYSTQIGCGHAQNAFSGVVNDARGVEHTDEKFFLRLEPSEIKLDQDRLYACSQCSYQTSFIFQLENHMQRRHSNVPTTTLFHANTEPEQFVCFCCSYKSHYRFDLYEHFKQAHLETHNPTTDNNEIRLFCEELQKYACEYCRYLSCSSLSFIKHPCQVLENQIPERNTKTPKCSKCSYQTGRKDQLNRHRLTHATNEEINWFQCNICSYRTKADSNLKLHVLLKHTTGKDISWWPCSHCSYRARCKHSLSRHVTRRHATNEEIDWFQCDQCPYRAKQKFQLNNHKLQHVPHEEIKWLSCYRCSYRAKRKWYLKSHMLTHVAKEDIDWLPCNSCAYRAKSRSHLNHHVAMKHAVDGEITWFQCTHCSYRTKQNSNLKRHVTVKHTKNEEITWFRCLHCSYRAKLKNNLQKHLLVHASDRRQLVSVQSLSVSSKI